MAEGTSLISGVEKHILSEPNACHKETTCKKIILLSDVTTSSVKLLQPFNNYSCTLMLMYNLAEAEWVSIECDQSLLSHVICSDNIPDVWSKRSRESENFGTEGTCSANEVIRNGICFFVSYFLMENKPENMKKVCKLLRKDFVENSQHEIFTHLLLATSLSHFQVYVFKQEMIILKNTWINFASDTPTSQDKRSFMHAFQNHL